MLIAASRPSEGDFLFFSRVFHVLCQDFGVILFGFCGSKHYFKTSKIRQDKILTNS